VNDEQRTLIATVNGALGVKQFLTQICLRR